MARNQDANSSDSDDLLMATVESPRSLLDICTGAGSFHLATKQKSDFSVVSPRFDFQQLLCNRDTGLPCFSKACTSPDGLTGVQAAVFKAANAWHSSFTEKWEPKQYWVEPDGWFF